MTTTSLITPDLVEQACISTLRATHAQHLAALERQLGLVPETVERLETVDLLAGDDQRLAFDLLPAVLLSIGGAAEQPERDVVDGGREALAFPWRMDMDVVALGADRTDAMLRVRWLGMTVAECLLQRMARRNAPVESLTLTGIDFEVIGATGSALARAELTWTVLVPDSLTVRGHGLPVYQVPTTPAPGQPGGPPGTDYQLPVPWPQATDAIADVTRGPIEEDPTP